MGYRLKISSLVVLLLLVTGTPARTEKKPSRALTVPPSQMARAPHCDFTSASLFHELGKRLGQIPLSEIEAEVQRRVRGVRALLNRLTHRFSRQSPYETMFRRLQGANGTLPVRAPEEMWEEFTKKYHIELTSEFDLLPMGASQSVFEALGKATHWKNKKLTRPITPDALFIAKDTKSTVRSEIHYVRIFVDEGGNEKEYWIPFVSNVDKFFEPNNVKRVGNIFVPTPNDNRVRGRYTGDTLSVEFSLRDGFGNDRGTLHVAYDWDKGNWSLKDTFEAKLTLVDEGLEKGINPELRARFVAAGKGHQLIFDHLAPIVREHMEKHGVPFQSLQPSDFVLAKLRPQDPQEPIQILLKLKIHGQDVYFHLDPKDAKFKPLAESRLHKGKTYTLEDGQRLDIRGNDSKPYQPTGAMIAKPSESLAAFRENIAKIRAHKMPVLADSRAVPLRPIDTSADFRAFQEDISRWRVELGDLLDTFHKSDPTDAIKARLEGNKDFFSTPEGRQWLAAYEDYYQVRREKLSELRERLGPMVSELERRYDHLKAEKARLEALQSQNAAARQMPELSAAPSAFTAYIDVQNRDALLEDMSREIFEMFQSLQARVKMGPQIREVETRDGAMLRNIRALAEAALQRQQTGLAVRAADISDVIARARQDLLAPPPPAVLPAMPTVQFPKLSQSQEADLAFLNKANFKLSGDEDASGFVFQTRAERKIREAVTRLVDVRHPKVDRALIRLAGNWGELSDDLRTFLVDTLLKRQNEPSIRATLEDLAKSNFVGLEWQTRIRAGLASPPAVPAIAHRAAPPAAQVPAVALNSDVKSALGYLQSVVSKIENRSDLMPYFPRNSKIRAQLRKISGLPYPEIDDVILNLAKHRASFDSETLLRIVDALGARVSEPRIRKELTDFKYSEHISVRTKAQRILDENPESGPDLRDHVGSRPRDLEAKQIPAVPPSEAPRSLPILTPPVVLDEKSVASHKTLDDLVRRHRELEIPSQAQEFAERHRAQLLALIEELKHKFDPRITRTLLDIYSRGNRYPGDVNEAAYWALLLRRNEPGVVAEMGKINELLDKNVQKRITFLDEAAIRAQNKETISHRMNARVVEAIRDLAKIEHPEVSQRLIALSIWSSSFTPETQWALVEALLLRASKPEVRATIDRLLQEVQNVDFKPRIRRQLLLNDLTAKLGAENPNVQLLDLTERVRTPRNIAQAQQAATKEESRLLQLIAAVKTAAEPDGGRVLLGVIEEAARFPASVVDAAFDGLHPWAKSSEVREALWDFRQATTDPSMKAKIDSFLEQSK